MIVLIAWLKVRNLPKIDKGKKKNKEKETGKALESRLQAIENSLRMIEVEEVMMMVVIAHSDNNGGEDDHKTK